MSIRDVDAAEAASGEPDGEAERTAQPQPSDSPDSSAEDRELARQLFEQSRPLRQLMIDTDDRFWRLSLARMLVVEAEAALEKASSEAEERAELAAAIGAMLDSSEGGEERRTAAFACWLLGKARLKKVKAARKQAPSSTATPSIRLATGRAATPAAAAEDALQDREGLVTEPITPKSAAAWGRLRDAAEAFARMSAFVSRDQPSWERALSAVGLAQVRWRQGRHLDGGALFAVATQMFASVDALEPVAACEVQHGFLQLGAGEKMLARLELAKAQRLLDPAAAPTLAVLTALGLACCEAATGRAAEATGQLAKASAIWQGMPADPENSENSENPQNPQNTATVPAVWRQLLSASPVELSDRALLALLAGSPWRQAYPESLVTLADRLLLGRAEDEPALGIGA